jgi:hypothetical protein
MGKVGHFCNMKFKITAIALSVTMLTSCIIQSPKYTTLEQVMRVEIGMDKSHVDDMLQIEPYDLKSRTDTSNVYIYVYRVRNRQTLSIYTKPINGKEVTGRYIQMAIGYSKTDKVISIESCSLCPDNLVTKSKVDVAKVAVFFTVTVPAVLIYLGLQKQ